MTLYGDILLTIENRMLNVNGPTWMSNITSPREVVITPLNPDSRCLGFSKANG